MRQLPEISVVIPTFNRATIVAQAIESVLNQTYAPKEVIVIDDGSTDDTRAVVESFGTSVRYHYQANKGVGAARNTGIQAAGGEYIAFLDSDDIWLPQKLELQIRGLSQYPDAVASVTDVRLTDRSGESKSVFEMRGLTERPHYESYVEWPFDLAFGGCFCTPGWVIHRDVLMEIGGFVTGVSVFEDLELICRVAARGGFAIVPEALVECGWGQGATNLRDVAARKKHETNAALAAMYRRLEADDALCQRARRLVRKSRAGLELRIAAEARAARRDGSTLGAITAWRAYPSPINTLRVVPILLGSDWGMRILRLK